MLYLDASALVKLVVEEPESESLAAFLHQHRVVTLVSSVVARVELVRAARRHDAASALARAISLVHELALVSLDEDIMESASMIGDAGLRTLDALHLASAASLGSRLTALVAYDLRLLEAAEGLGLPTSSPT